ncbi:MAG: septal ring lytic transglycosylase RlpA family protein [Phenylobacterium sp.]|jgi:rare lipoprotein A|nr:septal ring lytic transglycosylase RlpA family protein [Phenylobacterium sp.]
MCSAAAARTPHPKVDASARPQTGKASYYGTHEAGEKTASGAPLAPDRMTAASPTLPLGTKAKVTNAETGKSVHVTVTDRGPYTKNRILDVTPKAAKQLGMKDSGVSTVKVQPLQLPKPSR